MQGHRQEFHPGIILADCGIVDREKSQGRYIIKPHRHRAVFEQSIRFPPCGPQSFLELTKAGKIPDDGSESDDSPRGVSDGLQSNHCIDRAAVFMAADRLEPPDIFGFFNLSDSPLFFDQPVGPKQNVGMLTKHFVCVVTEEGLCPEFQESISPSAVWLKIASSEALMTAAQHCAAARPSVCAR